MGSPMLCTHAKAKKMSATSNAILFKLHHQHAIFVEFTVFCIFQTFAKMIVILHSARV